MGYNTTVVTLSPRSLSNREEKQPQMSELSINDCQSLSADQQRMVALYLLLMLNKPKLHENNKEPGVLLFIDEAKASVPFVGNKDD